jgi:lipoprotein-anchoring transpeptidase ErfK/SrfK
VAKPASSSRLVGAPGARAGVSAYGERPARLAIGSASRRGKALPAHSGVGQRIVYQESTMHLWVVGADGTVLRDYPVTGRPGWPRPGSYHVFSKVLVAASPKYHVTFDWMVRFAHGNELNIGFHDIPRLMGSGVKIQADDQLGAPIGHGGCVRQRTVDAKWLYVWASIGTKVVVLR